MYFYFAGGLISTPSGNVLYSEVASPNIYEVKSNGETIIKYKIDLGSEIWPEDKRYELNEFFQALGSLKIDVLGSKYLDSEKVFYFDYMDNNKSQDKEIAELIATKHNTDGIFNRFVTVFANRARHVSGELSLGRETEAI
jgi:hypothetical protein